MRRRWATSRVRITDEGDRLIIEPEPENPFEGLLGILAGPDGPTLPIGWEEQERELESEVERRKFGVPFEDDAHDGAAP